MIAAQGAWKLDTAYAERSSLISALKTVRIERDAIAALGAAIEGTRLGTAFSAAVEAIVSASGRLIVTGMGKSGIIARKIAATMTSTGTPAMFIHPGEASHGDLGMITVGDMVLALSWSGETSELGDIIAYCKRFKSTLIVATSRPDSTAGRAADICLALPVVPEACPNQLAPTSSTTIQTVLGDALAVALIEERGFSKSDFAVFHPGGRLGAQLSTVRQLMGSGEEIPVIASTASLVDATFEMSRKRYGATAIVDKHGKLVGVFTDGDLRRAFATNDIYGDITTHMSMQPVTILPDKLLSEALRILNDNAITVIFVCDGDGKLLGAVHLHDILRAGVS